ncbi:hypothetical protein QEN19_000653 [Hanseniaspora menglaensis]
MAKKSSKQTKQAGKTSTAKKDSPVVSNPIFDTKLLTFDFETSVEVPVSKGPERPFVEVSKLTEGDKLSKIRNPSNLLEYILIFSIITITVIIRMKDLEYPDSVVFDEVHFGKFAAQYITGTYFFDVHPPLSKMMFAFVGYLGGFKGDFLFENIGDFFPQTTPYYAMRLFASLCGAITCILMYLTLRSSGVKPVIGLVGTLLFIWENSFVTISRYILLDSPLILFISFAAYYYKKYQNYSENSLGSLKYLILTGVFLGLSLSSKWVGLFTIAWIGALCLIKMFFMVGDLNTPLYKTTAVATKWGAILLGIPAIVYLISFQMHFSTLINDSDGASLLSSSYRSELNGNQIPKDIIKNVGYGSVVSIKHVNTNGGYLHSHNIFYTTGSEQQQLTLYPHIDTNNDFLVEKYNETTVPLTKFEALKNGDKIRLKHINTHKRVHSHDHKPPVSSESDWQLEASAYGFENFEGDPNDDFVVEIDEYHSTAGESREVVNAIETKFRLRHAMTGCLLFSHPVNFPEGGQQEVTCAHAGIPSLTLWYIEHNTNPFLFEGEEVPELISYPKLGFWGKFLETNKKMWSINNGFTESHIYQSDPASWPLLTRGISYWAKDHRQVYLLGNAVVWWLSTATVAIFSGMLLVQLFKYQLSIPLNMDKDEVNSYVQITEFILGWALHYLPFFLMGRQLFLHHYLPAYYFLIMAFTQLLNLFVVKFFKIGRNKIIIAVSLLVILLGASYQFFDTHKNFAYGSSELRSTCVKGKWMNDWDYSCDLLLEDWESYDNLTMSKPEAAPEGMTILDKHITNTPVQVDVEDIHQNKGIKKFIGPDGREIPEEDALKLIAKQGGKVMKVEDTVYNKGTGAAHENVAPQIEQPVHEQFKNQVQPGAMVNVNLEDIKNDKGPKKFLDQYGNEIDPVVAMKMLEDGGQIVDVQQSRVAAN